MRRSGTHQRIFTWVLERLAQGGLVRGKTIGVDSTTLEANAAMKSIVRRDTGESYTGYLQRLAEAEGIDAEDAAALRRMDRKRAKKMSNEVWESPNDPEAEITRLKDGRTALAFKAENAVDMETGAIVAVPTTVLSSAAGVDENPGSSRTRFRDRPETVRLHRGIGVHLHPGIAFTFPRIPHRYRQ